MAAVLASAVLTVGVRNSVFPPTCRLRAQLSALPHNAKKVVVVGSGWSGLASAHHLVKQGFDVTVLDVESCDNEEAGVGGNGFWYPYQNICSLVDELGIQPFTKWNKSALYSPNGMEVEIPVFHDLPKLPAPLGPFLYPQFNRLPVIDRMSGIPLIAAAIDFDNTDTAWQKYDAMTARELFKHFGCSRRLFEEVFNPMLQVSLLAPAEQCSAAATLGMLNYYMFSRQQNNDVMWCRGPIRDKIFEPWKVNMRVQGCCFAERKKVLNFLYNKDSECVSGVVCEEEVYDSDAVILAVGISTLQSIVTTSSILRAKEEFLDVLNLSSIDVLSVKLWMDKKIDIPKASNICYNFDKLTAWTFFDLSSIYDQYENETSTIIKADFYNANQMLLQKDEQIIEKVQNYLSKCIKEFNESTVLRGQVTRCPKSASHFFPGSYRYMMRGSTSIPNVVMAGDWIINRHGSWSQEKAYVTGLEAANRVVDYFEIGEFAKITPVEEDESHIETLRILNRNFNEIRTQIPFYDFFLQ